MNKKDIIKMVQKVVHKNNIKKAYLFGSFTTKKKYNDIDIAIEPPEDFSLLDLARLANSLEKKICLPVDLITLGSIHPKLRKSIQEQLIAI